MRISQEISDHHDFLVEAVPYLTISAVRLLITPEQITEVDALTAALNNAYGLYVNPLSHTPAAVLNVNTAYQNSLGFWRNIRQQMKKNTSVELSDFDYQGLDIHRDKTTRTPSKPPVYSPESTVTKRDHLVVQISSYQPSEPEENYRKLPQNARAIGRKIALVPHGSPTPDESDYSPLPSVSHAVYNLTFTLAEEGMTCNLITWYIGQRGGESPMSPPLAFQIP